MALDPHVEEQKLYQRQTYGVSADRRVPGTRLHPQLPIPPAAAAPRLPTSCPVASGTQLRSSTAGQTCNDQGVATPSPSMDLPRGSPGPETSGGVGGGCLSIFSQGG